MASFQPVSQIEERQEAELPNISEELISLHARRLEDYSIEPNYGTLLSMFPNVDAKYIRKICLEPPFDASEGDTLEMLINHLLSYDDQIDESELSKILEHGEEDFLFNSSDDILSGLIEEELILENESIANDHLLSEMIAEQDLEDAEREKQNEHMVNEQLLSEFLQQDKEVVDEKLEMLENILPDADPELLRKYVEENHDNARSLEQFVESKLVDKNYNKRDQYFENIKKKKNLNQYTTDFKVDRFIKQFPEPFEHFENPERTCTYQEKCLNFLKTRYNDQFGDIVASEYTVNKYNLSITDKYLQQKLGEPSVKINIDSNDIPFLQETAFIQNKNCIKNYLDEQKIKEEKEMQILRKKRLLFDCQCCYDEMKPTDIIECDNNHMFCKKCIIKGVNVAISDSVPSLKCFMGCDKEINLSILRKVVPMNIFEKFFKIKQEAEIREAQLDNLINCPFCEYSMELAPEIMIFTCRNPECKKITCRMCKKLNHLPFKCEEVLDEHKARLLIEENLSKTYIRYCPQCNKPIVKTHGCNKMQCICGALMCYICKKSIRGYDHFDRDNRCTTYRNSIEYDKEMINLTRVETISKIRKDFPELKLPDVQED